MPLPAWVAVRVHVPLAISVTLVLLTLHVAGVDEVTETGKPELADTVTVILPVVIFALPGCTKDIL